MARPLPMAPEFQVERWLNTPTPITLAGLRGRVVLALGFQMFCPGCVRAPVPQLRLAHQLFPAEHVQVLGLHTVFEHHAANTPEGLAAFAHENRLTMPLGIDRHDPAGGLPLTMAAYGMRGTPTLLLIDRAGRLRGQSFGHVEDMAVGAQVAGMVAEPV